MNDAIEEFTGSLHDVFQLRADEFFIPSDHEDQEEPPEAGVLISWTLVASWQGTDGEKWITYHRKPDQAVWETRGLLTEALNDLD